MALVAVGEHVSIAPTGILLPGLGKEEVKLGGFDKFFHGE